MTKPVDEFDEWVAASRDEIHCAPAHLKAQWHSTIDSAAASERGREPDSRHPATSGHFWWGFATAGALALAIVIGFQTIGFQSRDVDDVTVPPTDVPIAAMSTDFDRGLRYHLISSHTRLATLDSSPDATHLILEIIEQNRLFEAAAEKHNAEKVARVLRAFEPVLLRLAANDIAPEDADALREQLTFELNVMLTKLARKPSDQAHTT